MTADAVVAAHVEKEYTNTEVDEVVSEEPTHVQESVEAPVSEEVLAEEKESPAVEEPVVEKKEAPKKTPATKKASTSKKTPAKKSTSNTKENKNETN